jgi:hypothetical protein
MGIGLGFGWLTLHFSPDTDSYTFFKDSLPAYHALLVHPMEYISHIPQYFSASMPHNQSFFASGYTFWKFSGHQMLQKLMTFFDLLSGGAFLTNVLLFCVLVFYGHAALYRFFRQHLRIPAIPGVLAAFLIPSLLVWSSNFDKDGLLLLFLGLLLLGWGRLVQLVFRWRDIGTVVICLGLIALIRDYMIVLLLPALACWWLADRIRNLPGSLVFAVVYLVAILCFFQLGKVSPQLDLPRLTSERQQQFQRLGGASRLTLPPLEPSAAGFLRMTPVALDHTLLQPYPWQLHKGYIWIALENLGLLILLALSLLFFRKNPAFFYSGAASCLFLGCSMLLMIGYAVPFLGAISRYRSIALPFLVAAISSWTDWKKEFSLVQKAG